jgi:hypothetical protein
MTLDDLAERVARLEAECKRLNRIIIGACWTGAIVAGLLALLIFRIWSSLEFLDQRHDALVHEVNTLANLVHKANTD